MCVFLFTPGVACFTCHCRAASPPDTNPEFQVKGAFTILLFLPSYIMKFLPWKCEWLMISTQLLSSMNDSKDFNLLVCNAAIRDDLFLCKGNVRGYCSLVSFLFYKTVSEHLLSIVENMEKMWMLGKDFFELELFFFSPPIPMVGCRFIVFVNLFQTFLSDQFSFRLRCSALCVECSHL